VKDLSKEKFKNILEEHSHSKKVIDFHIVKRYFLDEVRELLLGKDLVDSLDDDFNVSFSFTKSLQNHNQ
jgi:hypothetical protein